MAAGLNEIVSGFKVLQDRICAGLESLDGKGMFIEERWQRSGGGGGRTRVISDGNVFEKGGVNFSHVHGIMPEKIASRLNLPLSAKFHATGVSIVIHPESPMVPIIHMNVRYFQMEDGFYWFGGGIDLTPIYIDPTQAVSFHRVMKEVCDKYDPESYDRFKSWCDEYFFLKHRQETRGVGGIFFDRLRGDSEEQKEKLHAFVQGVGDAFLTAYSPIVTANRQLPYGNKEKEFQAVRRSRYVEFNLLFDKGTKFGIDTNGRTESILMSMPPMAKWAYNYKPEENSREAQTMALLKPIDWINYGLSSGPDKL